MSKLSKLKHIWFDAMGQKADDVDKIHSDRVAITRTIIWGLVVIPTLITNIAIDAGILQHWDDNKNQKIIKIIIIHELPINKR